MSSLNDALNGAKSSLEKLETALLKASANGKSKLERDFRQAYPLLEQHIAGKVRKKLLMEMFNDAYLHQVNLVQFRKLLNAERERRKTEGEQVACATCGKLLCPDADVTKPITAEEDAR